MLLLCEVFVTSCLAGILVDDDGIWREEAAERMSHHSLGTLHTDSGIVPGTGKSSSATINQFRSENGSDEEATPLGRAPQPVGGHPQSPVRDAMVSSQLDSKSTVSYRISELENSESQQVMTNLSMA